MTEKIKPDAVTSGNYKSINGEAMPDKDTSFNLTPQFDPSDLADAPDVEPITAAEILAEVKGGNAAATGEITGEYLLLNKVESIPCLLDPFLPQTGLAALAGSSDTGKSMFLRQLAIAVTAGKTSFLGWKLNAKHQSAIVVSTEDDSTAISYLLNRQTQSIAPERLRSLRFLFDVEDMHKALDASLTAAPADVVIIDCFADAYGSDLKDTQKIRAFLMKCQTIAEKHKCLFLFLHHTGKRTENLEPSKNNLLSGQGFEGKMRLVIELRADPTRPDVRHICIVKGNYLASEHKRESYALSFDPDTFTFSATAERTPFELLAKPANDEGRAKYEQAKSMKGDGKTLDEIAKALNYSNRGGVSKLLKRFDATTEETPF